MTLTLGLQCDNADSGHLQPHGRQVSEDLLTARSNVQLWSVWGSPMSPRSHASSFGWWRRRRPGPPQETGWKQVHALGWAEAALSCWALSEEKHTGVRAQCSGGLSSRDPGQGSAYLRRGFCRSAVPAANHGSAVTHRLIWPCLCNEYCK